MRVCCWEKVTDGKDRTDATHPGGLAKLELREGGLALEKLSDSDFYKVLRFNGANTRGLTLKHFCNVLLIC